MKRFAALLFVLLLVLTGCQGKTVMEGDGAKISNMEFAYHYWTEINSSKEAPFKLSIVWKRVAKSLAATFPTPSTPIA